tara:strand:- start:889 stop:1278 length:390 start_codon:yes stop_codon:yes gene_type:complete
MTGDRTAGHEGRALVMFHGAGGRWYSRFLKPGFRHCFVAVEWRGYWIVLDPRPDLPGLHVTQGSEESLRAFYEAHGFTVLGVTRRRAAFRAPFMAASCVSAVKWLIGARAPFVLTPRQLHRLLSRSQSP